MGRALCYCRSIVGNIKSDTPSLPNATACLTDLRCGQTLQRCRLVFHSALFLWGKVKQIPNDTLAAWGPNKLNDLSMSFLGVAGLLFVTLLMPGIGALLKWDISTSRLLVSPSSFSPRAPGRISAARPCSGHAFHSPSLSGQDMQVGWCL